MGGKGCGRSGAVAGEQADDVSLVFVGDGEDGEGEDEEEAHRESWGSR